jgi:hypothetical protein
MMPSKTSCMFSLEKVGTLYGERVVHLMSRVSLRTDLYMAQEDQVFVGMSWLLT